MLKGVEVPHTFAPEIVPRNVESRHKTQAKLFIRGQVHDVWIVGRIRSPHAMDSRPNANDDETKIGVTAGLTVRKDLCYGRMRMRHRVGRWKNSKCSYRVPKGKYIRKLLIYYVSTIYPLQVAMHPY